MDSPAERRAQPRLRTALYAVAGALAGIAALALVYRVATAERDEPARCPRGLVALGARCCGQGQVLAAGHCAGAPKSCAQGMLTVRGPRPGCAAGERRVAFPGGALRVSPADWEPRPNMPARQIQVAPFELDAHEVSVERWERCVAMGGCRRSTDDEPGRPVTRVAPAEALQFCRFFGGRLPTSEEWLFAAAGPNGRRFPWGNTGLVCRRSVFGLVDGPCARAGTGPEIIGSRPDGRTPEGVFDLSGNVAEWTLETGLQGAGGHPEFAARGGSYRSKVAPELKSWGIELTDRPAAHIGFRCAYAPD